MPNDGDMVNPEDVDICGKLPEITEDSAWYEVQCHKTGQVVIIQHNKIDGDLSVCEVEVYEVEGPENSKWFYKKYCTKVLAICIIMSHCD